MIIGERVRLRAIEREDLPRFVCWFNDPEVVKGVVRYWPMSTAEEERWFEKMLEGAPEERPLAIDALAEGRWVHIGSCGFMNIDHRAKSAEAGISIGDKQYWHQGLGTEAMRLLIHWGFATLNFHRIFLRVYAYNEQAIHLYRKMQFQEEGRMREDRYYQGRYWDTLIMGLLRREWDVMQNGGQEG